MGRNVTDVGFLKKEEKKELKKHAAAIHCSNTLTLLQRKITNALLYHAYKELMLKDEHEITVKQLCRLIGYAGNNHSAIKDALRGLISTVIEWNLIDEETGAENWTASSIIASVSLEGPVCFYAYSPRMKQLLHSPSMFGKIDLVIQSHFRSSYGLALYENCIRYRGLPYTRWFEIDLFRKLMGVPPGMYDIFRDFKRRVLDKAIDEVNMYSDLFVESELQREGRRVTKLRFKLKERAKKTRLGGKSKSAPRAEQGKDDALKEKLFRDFNLSEEQIEQLLTEYDASFVQDKIAVVEASKPFQTGRVQNAAGYLLSAVKQNYQMPKSKQTQVINIQDARQEMEVKELVRAAEKIRKEHAAYKENRVTEVLQAMTEEERASFMEGFRRYADPFIYSVLKVQRKKYTRETVLQSPQIKALLRGYAIREMDALADCSFEIFLLQLAEHKREAWQKLKSCDPDNPALKLDEWER